jgi:small neutral amino acid transporter SnatA (MarC family)
MLGSLGLKANCPFDGSVGVFASLAAVMSPIGQLHIAANVAGNKPAHEERRIAAEDILNIL